MWGAGAGFGAQARGVRHRQGMWAAGRGCRARCNVWATRVTGHRLRMLATGSRAQGEEANGNVTASVLTWLNVTHSCAKLVRKLRIWGQILRKGVLGPEGSMGSPLGPSELGEGAAVGEKG